MCEYICFVVCFLIFPKECDYFLFLNKIKIVIQCMLDIIFYFQ